MLLLIKFITLYKAINTENSNVLLAHMLHQFSELFLMLFGLLVIYHGIPKKVINRQNINQRCLEALITNNTMWQWFSVLIFFL